MFGCDDGDTHDCEYMAKLKTGDSQKDMVVEKFALLGIVVVSIVDAG